MTLLKRLFVFAFVALIASSAFGQDPQVNIKGLYLGMDITDAKRVAEKILGDGWTVDYEKKLNKSGGYYIGDKTIFGDRQMNYYKSNVVGKMGLLLKSRYNYYEGYVAADTNNKVIKIHMSGKLLDHIYSSQKVTADDFQEKFREHFKLPRFGWIPHGWEYQGDGFLVRFMTDKMMEIEQIGKIDFGSDETSIKF